MPPIRRQVQDVARRDHGLKNLEVVEHVEVHVRTRAPRERVAVREAPELLHMTRLDEHDFLATEERHVEVVRAIVVQWHHHALHPYPEFSMGKASKSRHGRRGRGERAGGGVHVRGEPRRREPRRRRVAEEDVVQVVKRRAVFASQRLREARERVLVRKWGRHLNSQKLRDVTYAT